jgi:hypothetical protein
LKVYSNTKIHNFYGKVGQKAAYLLATVIGQWIDLTVKKKEQIAAMSIYVNCGSMDYINNS